MSRTQRIEVHIDELVLHGFQPGDRRGIAEAIEREVARSLASHGVALDHGLVRDRQVTAIDGGQVRWGDAAGPGRIGTAVAHAVGSRLEAGMSSRDRGLA